MTLRVRARSVNVSSEGHVTPYPSVGARLGVGSVIRMSLDRAQIVVVETGARTGVAGRADLVDPDEQCVTVAVQRDSLDVLRVAGRVALAPVLTAAAGPERHPSRRQRASKRLVVHPADHQHLTAVVLLHDGTHQTLAVALQTRSSLG